jgi:hypothetical protein
MVIQNRSTKVKATCANMGIKIAWIDITPPLGSSAAPRRWRFYTPDAGSLGRMGRDFRDNYGRKFN